MVLLKGAEAELEKYDGGTEESQKWEYGGLMTAYDQVGVLQRIKREFQDLGYIDSLLQEDYAYADVLAPDPEYAGQADPSGGIHSVSSLI